MIEVRNEELRTVREAMREMTAILDQLEQRDLDKVVLTQRGKLRGILLSPNRYALLTQTKEGK